MKPPAILRVLKLGGSLLSLDDWRERFRKWLSVQTPARNVLVVGGGKLADAVRDLDRDSKLGEFESHWMCIAAMAINASRVAEALDAQVSSIRELLESSDPSHLTVLDPWRFLRDEEHQFVADPLPVGWHVTSDSIAARVAHAIRADELVLLKSRLPAIDDVNELAKSGYVDAYFPDAAHSLPRIVCVDLRSDACNERVISKHRD